VGAQDHIRWFEHLGLGDLALVGGKNASLGELYSTLKNANVLVPDGFAITADAYRDALGEAGAWAELHKLLDGLDVRDVAALSAAAKKARKVVYDATGGAGLRDQIIAAYRKLQAEYGKAVRLAVRSSATAEDLPTASFAGQHESYLHVHGDDQLIEACRNCFASIFTDRAIVYRTQNGFDHFKVYLSVGVMKMVRSDERASGVIFTLDTESGFRDVVFVTASYGLGESIVQGKVDPDEFYVHKPTYNAGHRAVLRRSLGAKQTRLVFAKGRDGMRLKEEAVVARDRGRFCITDAEVLELAGDAIAIENHYSKASGRPTPMDIEWAKDADDGRLYILQARPETVASQKAAGTFETYSLKGSGKVLASGKAVGEKIASGKVRVIRGQTDLELFKPGEVLVAPATSPDWEPVMKTAAAIVTDRGGRTCHAAIVARELGVPAVVGAGDATAKLADGAEVTVSCAEGEAGHVYEGAVPFAVEKLDASKLPHTRTQVMVNLAHPDLAFRTGMLPSAGVGLARMEFIISNEIRLHPMAAAHPERVPRARDRAAIDRLAAGYASPRDYFIGELAEGVGTIAAAFWPRPVIVRLSDFKTNEYAQLLGGAAFEPKEENPMLGFRGAARYAHPAYADGFALECEALVRVRRDMGLTNLKVMVPFCRRVEEAKDVIDAMAAHGLKRGKDGLELYVMCEIPNNVMRIDAFAELFDGFSIGSNDLTQLTLGVDRDSETVAFDFDERDPGVLEMLRLAVEGAKRNRRHVGICGEAPATYPEIAAFLARLGIESISVNPSSLPRTIQAVADAEHKLAAA